MPGDGGPDEERVGDHQHDVQSDGDGDEVVCALEKRRNLVLLTKRRREVQQINF